MPEIKSAPPVPVLGFLTSVPVATLAALLFGAIETASIGLLPVYALRAGFSPETGALFVTLFALGNIIFQFPVGFVSDQMDRSKLLLFLAIVSLCGAVALAFAGTSHFLLFCVLLVIWGGIVGSLYAVGLAHLGSRYSGPELGKRQCGLRHALLARDAHRAADRRRWHGSHLSEWFFLLHRGAAHGLSRSGLRAVAGAGTPGKEC